MSTQNPSGEFNQQGIYQQGSRCGICGQWVMPSLAAHVCLPTRDLVLPGEDHHCFYRDILNVAGADRDATGEAMIHRILKYARIEDELGNLSLTTLALLLGAVCLFFGKPGLFFAALGLYAIKKLISHSQVRLAMEGAQEAALLQMQNDHEIAKADESPLAGKLAALEKRVHELATPERDAALNKAFGGRKA